MALANESNFSFLYCMAPRKEDSMNSLASQLLYLSFMVSQHTKLASVRKCREGSSSTAHTTVCKLTRHSQCSGGPCIRTK